MALPKKHSRTIAVAGVPYRWCIGKRTFLVGLGSGDRVVVQGEECEGAKLIVHLHPFWCDERSLTPRHVADFIQDAIDSGWRPLEPGSPFEIRNGMPHKWA